MTGPPQLLDLMTGPPSFCKLFCDGSDLDGQRFVLPLQDLVPLVRLFMGRPQLQQFGRVSAGLLLRFIEFSLSFITLEFPLSDLLVDLLLFLIEIRSLSLSLLQ